MITLAGVAPASALQPATWSGSMQYSRTTDQSQPALCPTGTGTWHLQQTETWTLTIPERATVMGEGVTVSLEGTISGSMDLISTRVCNGVEKARSVVHSAGTGALWIEITQPTATGDVVELSTSQTQLGFGPFGLPGTQTLDGGAAEQIEYWPDIHATVSEDPPGHFAGSVPAEVGLTEMQRSFVVDSVGFDWGTEPLTVDLVRGAVENATTTTLSGPTSVPF
jgi:hypothetical protein